MLLLSGVDAGVSGDCARGLGKLDRLSSADVHAFISCAEDFERSTQTAAALDAYRQLRTALPMGLDAWQGEVRLLIKSRRFKEARKTVEQWNEAVRGLPWPLALREELARSPAERKEASARFMEYVSGLEKDEPLNLMVGEVFADRGDWKQARKFFERCLDSPQDIWARYAVAVSSMKLGDWKRADEAMASLSRDAAQPIADGPNVPPVLVERLKQLRAQPNARVILGMRAGQRLKPGSE